MNEPDRNEFFTQQISHCLTEAQHCAKQAGKMHKFHLIFIVISIAYNVVFIPVAVINFLRPGWSHLCVGVLILALCAHVAWYLKGHIRERTTDFNKWMGYREQWLGYAAQWKQYQKDYNNE